MLTTRFAAVCVVGLAAAGCQEQAGSGFEDVAQAELSIVGGSNDTTHQAVVAWIHNGKCSATIVARQGSTGYALTAAHCVNGNAGELRQGNNHNNPDRTYPVTTWTVHPGYALSDAYDVAMVQFSGADAATPILPMLTAAQDNINTGMSLDAVGYGITPNNNSTRRHVQLVVDFDSELLIGYDQTSSGICSGDSGGSSLHTIASTEYVAGVHSFTTGTNCTGNEVLGVDIRVSAVLDTFINPYINGQPTGTQTCDQCIDAHYWLGECGDESAACGANNFCGSYRDCLNACNSYSCQVACGVDNPNGKWQFDLISSCICSTCSVECAGDNYCEQPPACFLQSPIADCQTCYEDACCDEVTQCAADEYCYDCMTSLGPDINCPNDPTVAAMLGCLDTNCSRECPGGNPGTGGGGGGDGGMGAGGMGTGGMGSGAGGDQGATGGSGANDAATEPFVVESGCGCRLDKPRDQRPSAWLAAFGLTFMVAARRRRERAGSRGRVRAERRCRTSQR